jgi:IMP dehydrogenase/GMP reductase
MSEDQFDTQTRQETTGAANENTEKKERVVTEEFKVSGEAIVTKVKELIREGNIRRITVKNDTGKVLLEIPLTVGIVGTLLLPQLAALGALGALIANLTIAIEREKEDLVKVDKA